MLVSYPPSTTRFLRLPFTGKMCLEDNIKYKDDTTVVLEARRKEARRIDSQEW
jgi:predicted hotdog family 3-hydroxylacyl-ACP dehydratase